MNFKDIEDSPGRRHAGHPGVEARPQQAQRQVELRGEQACLAWLSRKAVQHGFELTSVQAMATVPNTIVRPGQKIVGMRDGGPGRQSVTLGTVLFEGELRITDVGAFLCALSQGIGPGRAYGCGLLSIAPTRP